MKKEFDTIEEAEALVTPLLNENKWVIAVVYTKDQKYLVQWIEQKMYTAQDGKEYRDEVWTTIEGEMKLIQDLEPEHARNVLRMILRNERERKAAMDILLDKLAAQMEEELEDIIPTNENTSEGKTLH
jgi:hypothetical protein